MIVRKFKDSTDICKMVKPYKKAAIIGCGGCYGEGGKPGVLKIEKLIKETGIEVVASGVTARQCTWIERASKKQLNGDDAIITLARTSERIKEADVLVSLACGVGVQSLTHFAGKKAVLPGFDTFFMGLPEGEVFKEQCIGCGNCILHLTGGICPIAKCPKSIMNGPCGGVLDNSCEVYPENNCVWIDIYNRLKDIGELENMKIINNPKDFSIRIHPRSIK
jgi:hypothetical protein